MSNPEYKQAIAELSSVIPSEPLQVQNLKEISKFIPKKKTELIADLIHPKTLTAIWGEPASCKSFLVAYLGLCLASKKKFLDVKQSQRSSVLYVSTENSVEIDAERLFAVSKGLKISPKRRKFFPFHYLARNDTTYLSDNLFFLALKQKIKELEVKVLIVDTISPLISDLNDNLASEIITIFKERLLSLIDELGVTIIVTMHSQKTGRDFLGSIKFKATCDNFFQIVRQQDNTLKLLCEKSRQGENSFVMRIDFQTKEKILKEVQFKFLEEFSGKQTSLTKDCSPQKQTSCENAILEFLSDSEMKYNEVFLEIKKSGFSLSTFKRAMNSLYEQGKIRKKAGKQGGYYKNEP